MEMPTSASVSFWKLPCGWMAGLEEAAEPQLWAGAALNTCPAGSVLTAGGPQALAEILGALGFPLRVELGVGGEEVKAIGLR